MSYDDVCVSMITMDEEGAVARVVRDVRRQLPGAEVMIVDSSEDRTPQIAAELGVTVVRQFPPQGYGSAMVRALTEPARAIVITLDCDDTYPTEVLPEMVRRCRAGTDVVGTTRISRGRPGAMPLPNYWANRLFNLTATLLFWRRVRDVHSGMRAYRRSMIHAIMWDPKGPALPIELLLKPMRLGYAVVELPIEYRERIGETTLHRWSSTSWTFKRIWRSRAQPVERLRAG